MKLKSTTLKSFLKKLAIAGAENTMLDTTEGILSASGPDMTIVVVNPVLKASDPEDQVQVGVNTRHLSASANRMTGEIDLCFELGTLIVKTAKVKFELAKTTFKGAEALDWGSDLTTNQVSLPTLKTALAYAATAAVEKERVSYSGSIQVSNNKAVATNGQRLAMYATTFPGIDPLIIPLPAARALRELDGEVVTVAQTPASLIFAVGTSVDSVTIVSKKLVKEFPAYESVINVPFSIKASIATAAMKEALRNVEWCAMRTDGLDPVRLSFKADTIKLSSGSSGGNAEDEIAYSLKEPDPIFEDFKGFDISLSHRFLSDFFESADGEVTFNANKKEDPVWLEAGAKKAFICAMRVKS